MHLSTPTSPLLIAKEVDPALLTLAVTQRNNALCVRCGRPHAVFFFDIDNRSTQGHCCATYFSADGLAGRSGYGSRHDDSRFFVAKPHRELLRGADPVCDSCLGSALLRGEIFDMGAPIEIYGSHPMPLSDLQAMSDSRSAAMATFKRLAQKLGRVPTLT